jgi:hypothetical protein
MPAFDGITTFFGVAVQIRTAHNPVEMQMVSAPGVHGVAGLPQGRRGKVSLVRGVLWAANVPALLFAKTLVESYIDGLAYPFVDNFGVAHPRVQVVRFQPDMPVRFDARWRYHFPYEMDLFHFQ